MALKKKIIYFLLPVALFLLVFVRPQIFAPLKLKLVEITSWPVRIVAFPLKELKKILYYHRTYHEYVKARKQLVTLKARLIGMEEVIRENTRLEQLLEFKRRLVFSSVAANVIARDPSNWNANIIVDKGRREGIVVGMPVVSAQGVVGKVIEVSEHRSKIILLTDPVFSVAAVIKRSREIGQVSGTLTGLSRMRYLSPDANVQVGDEVITSKLSTSFPEGLYVGDVIDVRHRKNVPSVECVIQPAVPLSQLEEVLIVQTTE